MKRKVCVMWGKDMRAETGIACKEKEIVKLEEKAV